MAATRKTAKKGTPVPSKAVPSRFVPSKSARRGRTSMSTPAKPKHRSRPQGRPTSMARAKATRAADATLLTHIPNVGPSIAADLAAIGIRTPAQLVGKDPTTLYHQSNKARGMVQDPCLLDCFISAVRFMEGGPPTPWWKFTEERKRMMGRTYG
ncbi:MAG: helix-hairpin-helix domain-containing protein [Phycisphaerales bacterium]